MTNEEIHQLAQRLRIDSIRASSAANSGHPTSSMSAADLMAVLMARHLRYDYDDAKNPNNDHLIFSKGHASPLVYAMFVAAGVVSDEELLTFRRFGSRLEGHPTPDLPWVDVATGSLGQGMPIAAGIALCARELDRLPYRVWALCGDSEMAEGSIWEAVEHAGKEGLNNLVVVVDVNRLGQRGETMHGWNLSSYSGRAEASGWNAIEIDGHDIEAIDRAYTEAESTADRPTMIVARTIKGYGASETANVEGKHGQPLKDPEKAIHELGDVGPIHVDVAKPESAGKPHRFDSDPSAPLPTYEVGGDAVPTRKAFGEGLAALMRRRGDVVALDGEVGNSTHLEEVLKHTPERYFEVYIAEQMLMAEAVGFQVRDWTPFAATFAAFLSRAYDFVRMAVISQAKLCINGSHAGVSIGEDGPSQMALEDLAEFRALGGSVVLYPSDPNQTVKLVQQMAEHDGISYLRSTRSGMPTLYGPDEEFTIGGSRIVRESEDDQVTLIGAGVTLHEALKAADTLAADGINARVIDLYSVKPLDVDTLSAASRATGGRFVVAEDHWVEGGIGEAVLTAFADADERPRVVQLAVHEIPGSGKGSELLHAAGIDADAIGKAARRLTELGPQIGRGAAAPASAGD
ncbi:MAG TPA: transketolase [Solirubrobacteraceae bacterium]|nr:transketolase [Solirubrobacteraceae bacterium]